MREKPIIFSAPMVRAILDGRKTQTRRIVKPPRCATLHGRQSMPDLNHADPGLGDGMYLHWAYGGGDLGADVCKERVWCPYGVPGDRLWVRETFCYEFEEPGGPIKPGAFLYRADGVELSLTEGSRWLPSIHMPRAASRITLEIAGVRVERLQEIDAYDIQAEGIHFDPCDCEVCFRARPAMCTATEGLHFEAFEGLWDKINGKRAPASSNPWVWVLQFGVVRT